MKFEDSKHFKGVPVNDKKMEVHIPKILTKHSKGFLLGVSVGLMAPIVATGLAVKHLKSKK